MTLTFLGRSLCHWSLDVKFVDSTVYLSTCDITRTRRSPTHIAPVPEFNRHSCKGGQCHCDIISSYIHRKSWESGGRWWEVNSVPPTEEIELCEVGRTRWPRNSAVNVFFFSVLTLIS